MVFTAYLWWFGGCFIIVLPCFTNAQNNRSPFAPQFCENKQVWLGQISYLTLDEAKLAPSRKEGILGNTTFDKNSYLGWMFSHLSTYQHVSRTATGNLDDFMSIINVLEQSLWSPFVGPSNVWESQYWLIFHWLFLLIFSLPPSFSCDVPSGNLT